MNRPDFKKMVDLVPAIIQDCRWGEVLMLGYMNEEAWQKSLDTGWVTFYSRSRNELWTKGETSGNKLKLQSWTVDCDNDCILIQAEPMGPTCHTGTASCFREGANAYKGQIFSKLNRIVKQRQANPCDDSYTSKLFSRGTARMAQKVGEEGVETSIAAVTGSDEDLVNETADLLFHTIVLLRDRGLSLTDVAARLEERNRSH